MKPCYCINPSCKQPDHPDNNNTQVILERLDKIEKQLQKKKLPKPPKPKNNKLRNGLIAVGGILLLLAAYPSYIFWRYGFSATNPLLLNRNSDEFIYKTLTTSGGVYSIAYSPDGKYLASGENDTIKIWDIETGRVVRTLTGDLSWASSIVYSPDGKYLAAGGYF